MSEQKPSVGRVVHYVVEGVESAAAHRAAIVTEVSDGAVELAVFAGGGTMIGVGPVAEDPACRPGTWHWPERT